MKKISLTRGESAVVDDIDYERLNKIKWALGTYRGNIKYAVKMKRVDGRMTCILMHRMILGATAGTQIDHIDHNGLNNQRSNLRFCTTSQNQANRRIKRNTITGFKGVFKGDPRRTINPWFSQIGVRNKKLYLGSWPSPSLAALAYNEAAKKYFGEYAQLNTL